MYLDWLMKNQFCPGCGSKVSPIDAGTKLICTSDPKEIDCPVKRTKVNNVCFPRTDPVTIIAVLSQDGKKILLGHNKRHRKEFGSKMFTTVAGFMEPGETIEESTTREIWEETGCKVSQIKIMKSQPWPFPACLMIGCFGYVEFNGVNEKINLELDKELDECRWFNVEDIRKLAFGESIEGLEMVQDVTLPFNGSIAFELIKAAVAPEKSRL
ncbi:unnamed protein product [Ambrosiozyma monospora]|uniref:Unnamed protein product n=1 Tax=Ambrosiozyma monospora TaxID=43982 RepID=A0ACB5T581_AMBMO|nr:unnamed protein product [Ambrosiozyma monospora]